MKRRMTLPNKITLTRAALAIIMFLLMIWQTPIALIAASLIFAFASSTDWIDGKIARSTNSFTPFGAIVDPFVDKILVGAAFFAFTDIPYINVPVWAVFFIILRELMVSTLRALAALDNNKAMGAERWGKFKTAFQLIALGVIFFTVDVYSLMQLTNGNFKCYMAYIYFILKVLIYPITVITAAITCLSAITYLKNNWEMLKKSWSLPVNE